MAARCSEAVIVSPNTGPSAGTKLTTPSGTPASRMILKIVQLDSSAVSEGFQSTPLPCHNKELNEGKKVKRNMLSLTIMAGV